MVQWSFGRYKETSPFSKLQGQFRSVASGRVSDESGIVLSAVWLEPREAEGRQNAIRRQNITKRRDTPQKIRSMASFASVPVNSIRIRMPAA